MPGSGPLRRGVAKVGIHLIADGQVTLGATQHWRKRIDQRVKAGEHSRIIEGETLQIRRQLAPHGVDDADTQVNHPAALSMASEFSLQARQIVLASRRLELIPRVHDHGALHACSERQSRCLIQRDLRRGGGIRRIDEQSQCLDWFGPRRDIYSFARTRQKAQQRCRADW